MNKLLSKIAVAFVGMSMAIGVGFAVGSGKKISAARAAPVTITKTTNQLVEANGWTVSSGNNIGDLVTEFSLDSNITISTSGNANCGSIWGTTTYDWRLYQAQSGDVTVTAASGYQLSSITFIFSVSSNGQLKDGNTTVNSSSAQSVSGTSKTYTVGASSGSKGQVRITSFSVTYSAVSLDPSVTITSSAESKNISKMKGETDTNVRVTLANIASPSWSFTFDEDEENGKLSSSYVGVLVGSPTNNVYPLTISLNAVGSTVIHISVSNTACADTISVTVNQRPSSLQIVQNRSANPLVDITSIELQNGDATGRSFSKNNIYVEDTDGNAITISGISDVSLTRLSGDDCVSISGGKITGTSVGTAVVKFTLKSLESIYDTLTVNVIDDYLVSVNSVALKTGLLEATQGNSPTTDVFDTRVGNTHFSSTATIPLEYFRFSYNDELGTSADQFGYDFSHGDVFDSTHKDQVIYVYCTLGNVKIGTYSVRVEQLDDPLAAIVIMNVTSNAKHISRNTSFQLEWEYETESGGSNPTDGKGVIFTISDDSSISVSSNGLISAGSIPGATARITIKSDHDASISDYVDITIDMESMEYTIDEELSVSNSPVTSITIGDKLIISGEGQNAKRYITDVDKIGSNMCGIVKNTGNDDDDYTTKPDATDAYIVSVVSGNQEGTYGFKHGNNFLAWSSGNTLTTVSEMANNASWTVSFSNSTATITNYVQDSGSDRVMLYNVSSPRICCYKGQSVGNSYYAIKLYKVTGGESTKYVDAQLFNSINNNFGTEKTYAWSNSCASFNSSNWQTACSAITGLSGYSNYKLNRAVANGEGNELEQFLAKYDFIVEKFGTAHDYLERFSSGGINYSARNFNSIDKFATETTATTIVIVLSFTGIAIIGGYFFIKKRKENY